MLLLHAARRHPGPRGEIPQRYCLVTLTADLNVAPEESQP
jgi:hypothetical protein